MFFSSTKRGATYLPVSICEEGMAGVPVSDEKEAWSVLHFFGKETSLILNLLERYCFLYHMLGVISYITRDYDLKIDAKGDLMFDVSAEATYSLSIIK